MTTRAAVAWAIAATALLALAGLVLSPVAGVVAGTLGLVAAAAARFRPGVGRVCREALVRWLPSLLGWAVIVVAVDWSLGWALDTVTGDERDVSADEALAEQELPPTTDPRVNTPAYADSPWADRFLAEMERLDYGYVPIIGPRVEEVHGRYINSAEGVRRSYEPERADGPAAVEVWFFGGSTMWGEGQRDLHTIPSEVARLAEADGHVLRVVNFGGRGYTAYQEALLFEQELAERGPPDVAVFYDGQNEIGTQQETLQNLSEQPTVYQLATVLDALARAPALPGAGAPEEPSVRASYVETSAVGKLLRRLGLVEPADAQELAPLEEVVDHALTIYARSVALQRELGQRAGVPVVNFWQPASRSAALPEVVAERLPPGVHDISDAFTSVPDDDLILIDGGHTNEEGARLAAEAIWEHLRLVVEGEAPR